MAEGNIEDTARGLRIAGPAGNFFCNHGTSFAIYNDTIQYRNRKGAGMKIGIIGAGNVGGTLGSRWAAVGHSVIFASRNPQSAEMQALAAKAGSRARSSTTAEAAAESEVVVLATPWPATKAAVEGTGPLAGKILIDATNPLLPDLSGLECGMTTSGAEQVAAWAPGARVVKAFNTIGSNVMGNPLFDGKAAVLFYCGDDAEAKAVVRQLAVELGFDAHDAGPLTQARLLEPFALLWISLAILRGYGRGIGFQFMQRPAE
ncbi:MAG: NADPH-dependent F420 reductase [Acidobacteria bacterium]|nr:NADPH-dependent F420 reductase [Acidobacteriota bacterium]